MGWVEQRRLAPPHTCELPQATSGIPGDIWKCSDCLRLYAVKRNYEPLQGGPRSHWLLLRWWMPTLWGYRLRHRAYGA